MSIRECHRRNVLVHAAGVLAGSRLPAAHAGVAILPALFPVAVVIGTIAVDMILSRIDTRLDRRAANRYVGLPERTCGPRHDARFISLRFTDVRGFLKGFALRTAELKGIGTRIQYTHDEVAGSQTSCFISIP